jgi:molybdopterin converting factor small subunit
MEIKLFATLRENREKSAFVDWHEGITGHAILALLDIQTDEVAIFLVNGLKSSLDTQLKSDDMVSLFPPIGGG